MSSKNGKVIGVLEIVAGIFVSVFSGWTLAPTIGRGLIALGVATIAADKTRKSLEASGALQRSTPTADPNALGAYVFGTTLVPMSMVYEEITGSIPDRVLHDVYAHAWHRIESYLSLTVATDAGPEVVSFTGNAATGAYSNLLWWFRADGTQSAALSGTPFDSNSWPSTAIFTGVSHSGLVWNIDDDNFKSKFTSVPEKIETEVQAAWLYDPRLDPTYGSGSQDYGTPSSWSFNDGNAALVLLRLLIGEYASGSLVWGRGAAETDIDMSSFVTAANVADEALDSDIRYRLGGMWLLSGSFEEFVQQWEAETGGKLSKSGGQYRVWLPNDDLTPLTTITEADIAQGGAIQHTIAGGLEGLYNTARGRYIDPDNGYTGKPYAEVSEASAVTADGGKRVISIDFSWVQSEAIAQRTARTAVRRSRFQRVWTIPMGWKGQSPNYAVFSVHNLNCLETNYSNQLVRVIDRKMSYTGLTVLTLQQEDVSIYDDTVALNDPLAGNNVTSKSSVFGTFPIPPSRYEERVTDPYFDESFGVAWNDDGNGGVSVSVGGGEGGENALVLTDASIGTPRMAINQPSFAVDENEKITGYARMKRTANLSLIQIGAQFYRSDTSAFVSATNDIIVQNSEMPLLNTYYTVQFSFTTSTPGLPSGVRLLAAIDVEMTPTGGGTATLTLSQLHARRSSDALDVGIPSTIIVHPSDAFTGTKVLKSTGAWQEPHPLTNPEIAAGVTPDSHEYPAESSTPKDAERYSSSQDLSDAASLRAVFGVPRSVPSGFSYVTGNIFDCAGPGLAIHDFDAEQEFLSVYSAQTGAVTYYVDGVNGNDANTGGLNDPFKTIGACMSGTSGLGLIYLFPGTYADRFDVRASQNTISGGTLARAVRIKAMAGTGTVIYTPPGDQPSVMTWSVTATTTFEYEATPGGGETALHVIYHEDNREIQIQHYASAAAVNAVASGWFQDAGTHKIYIRHRNLDLTVAANAERFEVIYSPAVGGPLCYGAKIFLDGITFRGGSQMDVIYQNSGGHDFRPVLYARNCKWQYLSYHNVQSTGGLTLFQDCVSEYSLGGDGWNYTDNGSPAQSAESTEIDCIGRFNGVQEYSSFDAARNKQGSSGHDTAVILRVNGEYYENYGQSIADTGSGSKTWMVGTICGNPFADLVSGGIGGFYSLWTEGNAFLDCVRAGGRASTYGLWVETGAALMYRCDLHGSTSPIGKNSGTTGVYNPIA